MPAIRSGWRKGIGHEEPNAAKPVVEWHRQVGSGPRSPPRRRSGKSAIPTQRPRQAPPLTSEVAGSADRPVRAGAS